jgi:hypothetical protein
VVKNKEFLSPEQLYSFELHFKYSFPPALGSCEEIEFSKASGTRVAYFRITSTSVYGENTVTYYSGFMLTDELCSDLTLSFTCEVSFKQPLIMGESLTRVKY